MSDSHDTEVGGDAGPSNAHNTSPTTSKSQGNQEESNAGQASGTGQGEESVGSQEKGASNGTGKQSAKLNGGSWGKDGSVNDYSRFEEIDDPANDSVLTESLRCKARGNDAFQKKDFAAAVLRYTEAISELPPKRDDEKSAEAKALRITLYSNRAACQLKLGNLQKCVDDASSAVKSDRRAAKALFRRAEAYEKMGRMEDACRDLYAIAAKSKPARKAFLRVKKQVHSRSLKAIAEAHRVAEAKEAKEAREKEEKKKREAAKKASPAIESKSNSSSTASMKRRPDPISEVDKAETQEDEEATLREVKKKGYCYFNTKMDEKTKALYANTTPQKINVGPAAVTQAPAHSSPKPLSASASGSFSDWNKAGTTWEEKDVSKRVSKELRDFLIGTAATPGDPKSATITTVPTCTGTASVACVRAKLRFFFDLNVHAKYSVGLEDGTTVTGLLKYPTMTALDMDDPDELFEVQITYNDTPTADRKAETKKKLKGLQAAVEKQLKVFAAQFLSTF